MIACRREAEEDLPGPLATGGLAVVISSGIRRCAVCRPTRDGRFFDPDTGAAIWN